MGNAKVFLVGEPWFSWIEKADAVCFEGEPLEELSGFWFVAAIDGVPSGYACIEPLPGENAGFLSRVGVLPRYRGNGLQRALIRRAERLARECGWDSVVTYVARWNVASANNFLHCGYRLYMPPDEWGVDGCNYFYRQLAVVESAGKPNAE